MLPVVVSLSKPDLSKALQHASVLTAPGEDQISQSVGGVSMTAVRDFAAVCLGCAKFLFGSVLQLLIVVLLFLEPRVPSFYQKQSHGPRKVNRQSGMTRLERNS